MAHNGQFETFIFLGPFVHEQVERVAIFGNIFYLSYLEDEVIMADITVSQKRNLARRIFWQVHGTWYEEHYGHQLNKTEDEIWQIARGHFATLSEADYDIFIEAEIGQDDSDSVHDFVFRPLFVAWSVEEEAALAACRGSCCFEGESGSSYRAAPEYLSAVSNASGRSQSGNGVETTIGGNGSSGTSEGSDRDEAAGNDEGARDTRGHGRAEASRNIGPNGDWPNPGIPEFRLEEGVKLFEGAQIYQDLHEVGDHSESTEEGHVWLCAKHLGAGTFGSCSLWLKVNTSTRKIVARTVIKDMQIHSSDWTSTMFWAVDGYQTKPLEAEIHERLCKTGNPNFLGYQSFSVDPEELVCRTYTEFAPLGGLDVACDSFFHAGLSARDVWYGAAISPIPEEYIWYAAKCLFSCILTLKDGKSHVDGAAEDDESRASDRNTWIPIVHRDIKLGNAVLGIGQDAIAQKFGWPNVRLIDFGSAIEMRARWKNPQCFTGHGTPAFSAPEMVQRWGVRGSREEISSAADVYSVGASLYAMTSGGSPPSLPPDPNYTEEYPDPLGPAPRLHGYLLPEDTNLIPFPSYYTTNLQTFIRHCLHFTPSCRIDPKTAAAVIDAQIAGLADVENPEYLIQNPTSGAVWNLYRLFGDVERRDSFGIGRRVSRRQRMGDEEGDLSDVQREDDV